MLYGTIISDYLFKIVLKQATSVVEENTAAPVCSEALKNVL